MVEDFSQKTKKKLWHRLLADGVVVNCNMINTEGIDNTGDGEFLVLSQKNLLSEYTPSAHEILSQKYKPMVPEMGLDDTGLEVMIGYREVAREVSALEVIGVRAITAHVTGNSILFENEGDEKDGELIDQLYSSWVRAKMKDALTAHVKGVLAVADGAIYMYPDEKTGKVRYKVFSKLKGDDIYKPTPDEFIRICTIDGVRVLEYYTDTEVSQWTQTVLSNKNSFIGTVWDNFLAWIKNPLTSDEVETKDGWKRISVTPHTYGRCPVEYAWRQDTLCGQGTPLRRTREWEMSGWKDANKLFSLPILTLNGKIESLPPLDSSIKTIGFSDEKGKADMLSAPDVSTALTEFLRINKRDWEESVGVVIINPEDIKGGNDPSGAYISNLYTRAVQTSIDIISELEEHFSDIISLFILMDSIARGDRGFEPKMNEAKYSWSLEPFIPKNEMEAATIMVMEVNAGVKSRETASKQIPSNTPFEWRKIQSEDEKKAETERKTSETINPETGNIKIEETEVADGIANDNNNANNS